MEKIDLTIEEAIETIKSNYPTSGYYMLRTALDMTIELFEKQIPQKPKSYHTIIFGDDRLAYDCPNCKHCFTMMKPNCDDVPMRNQYCDICGQKIDWSEANV